jgi:hypothetical protein
VLGDSSSFNAVKPNSGILFAVLFTGVVTFFVGALLAKVYPDGDSKPLYDLAIAAIGAFAGATAGVWIGLSVDKKRREQETEDRRVEAANIAIFSLSQIYSHISEYNQRVIAPRANDPRRWYEISRAMMTPPTIPPFDVDRLAFLFEGPYKNLMGRLSIDFVRFEGFLGLVRSAWDWNMQAQQLCAAQDTPPQNTMEIEKLIGHVRLSALSNCTDGIIEYVHSLIPSVMSAALSLRAAMLSIYPHRTIIHFSPELSAVR